MWGAFTVWIAQLGRATLRVRLVSSSFLVGEITLQEIGSPLCAIQLIISLNLLLCGSSHVSLYGELIRITQTSACRKRTVVIWGKERNLKNGWGQPKCRDILVAKASLCRCLAPPKPNLLFPLQSVFKKSAPYFVPFHEVSIFLRRNWGICGCKGQVSNRKGFICGCQIRASRSDFVLQRVSH